MISRLPWSVRRLHADAWRIPRHRVPDRSLTLPHPLLWLGQSLIIDGLLLRVRYAFDEPKDQYGFTPLRWYVESVLPCHQEFLEGAD